VFLLALFVVARAWEVELAYSSEATISVSITNTWEKPVTVCVWGTPLEASSDIFKADLFTGVHSSGKSPLYIGILAKKAPTISDFVTLQPGQTLSASLDLFKGYWFPSEGEYKISLDTTARIYFGELDAQKSLSEALAEFQLEQMTSNSVSLQIDTVLPAPVWPEPSNATVGGPNPNSNCNSGTQVSQINTSGNNAVSASLQGYNYVAGTCTTAKTYYVTWFGACDSTRYTKVRTDLNNIYNGLRATYPVNCAGSSCTANTYAYVFPSDSTHTVYVCGYFWRVSSNNCVMDSQPGTLIHEMSHFNNVASTGDVTYGQNNCKNLASTNPNQAVRNADNFCFFTDSCPR